MKKQWMKTRAPCHICTRAAARSQLTRLRTYLGAFKFSTEEMEHPIRSLSGGQKAKLFFLRMILEDANVLLLDEPTRNLSPLSAPVIRALLLDFPGAILAVTHDRLLMQQWPGRVLRLTERAERRNGGGKIAERRSWGLTSQIIFPIMKQRKDRDK